MPYFLHAKWKQDVWHVSATVFPYTHPESVEKAELLVGCVALTPGAVPLISMASAVHTWGRLE